MKKIIGYILMAPLILVVISTFTMLAIVLVSTHLYELILLVLLLIIVALAMYGAQLAGFH